MKKTALIILGWIVVILFYFVYVLDRIITAPFLHPKIGFKRFLHNPNLQFTNLSGEQIESNMQLYAIIRVSVAIVIYSLYLLIW
jgi:hypothetical protein